MLRLLAVSSIALAVLAGGRPASAQRAVSGALPAAQAAPDDPCGYARCALGLAPRWHGLDVVRGADAARVTSLGFFWARDVRAGFAGSAPAVREARRALRLRRVGAALTDVGAALLAAGVARAAADGAVRRPSGALALGGLALVGASVPAQFAADGALSRAVWEYNARFAR